MDNEGTYVFYTFELFTSAYRIFISIIIIHGAGFGLQVTWITVISVIFDQLSKPVRHFITFSVVQPVVENECCRLASWILRVL